MDKKIAEICANFHAAWPEIIARADIAKYTGGLYTPKTMATYDYRGCGVPNSHKIGSKVVYNKEDLIKWLAARLEAVHAKS